jgi:hypothetical protein
MQEKLDIILRNLQKTSEKLDKSKPEDQELSTYISDFQNYLAINKNNKFRVSLKALHKFTPCTPKVSAYGVHSQHCWSTDPCTPRSVECST